MPSITVENYLKHIHLLEQAGPRGSLALMGRLAEAVGVSPGTATTMVKSMAEAGLADYRPREGVRLTREGRGLARQVLRRHRLVESFLVETLGMDWAEVHDEAEELEHAISDKVLEALDRFLGYPRADPHGDPIPAPGRDGRAVTATGWNLNDCPTGRPLTITRVLDQSPPFLVYLDGHGLVPGSEVTVTEREAVAEAATVRSATGSLVSVGLAVGEKVRVDEAGPA